MLVGTFWYDVTSDIIAQSIKYLNTLTGGEKNKMNCPRQHQHLNKTKAKGNNGLLLQGLVVGQTGIRKQGEFSSLLYGIGWCDWHEMEDFIKQH